LPPNAPLTQLSLEPLNITHCVAGVGQNNNQRRVQRRVLYLNFSLGFSENMSN